MRRALLALAAAASLAAAAAPEMPGREWTGTPVRREALRVPAAEATYRWAAPLEKSSAPAGERRPVVGFERPAPKGFRPLTWQAVAGGHVARFDIASGEALGLRARLDLANAPALEVRVAGTSGSVESMRVAAGEAIAWGPWTAGEAQSVEVFARTRPADGAVRLGGVVHFDRPLDAKAAGSCTVDTLCSTGDAALDAAIAERKKSLARITFVENGRSYTCSGTLVNSEQFPTPYFLTAAHCIASPAVANSVTSFWFYENAACGGGGINPDTVQAAGGMTLNFADVNTDQTLLTMRGAPPPGAMYSGWNAAKLAVGDAVVSLSHPAGDVSKLALGTVSETGRFEGTQHESWMVKFSRGIIEGGSSGSGLFTRSGGALQLRAVLSATTLISGSGMSCTNLDEYGVYTRFDIFLPQVSNFLVATSPERVPDDHGNTPDTATRVAVTAAGTTVTGRIDYAGDVDVLRLEVASEGVLVARDAGFFDSVGVLLDANLERLTSNDDAETRDNGYGITWRVSPGTYYLVTTRWESAGTGNYSLRLSLAPVATDNYTDLWWGGESQSGWGINLNHQGNIVFATLFTYDAGGAPLWLVMSNGDRQPDGSFQGELYQTRGPAFNAPWAPATATPVGRMKVHLAGETGYVEYTYNGVTVAKSIQRQRFAAKRTTCSWSAFDRSWAGNLQDLWYNPKEPGWGINLAHQGTTLFATLFTYGADGRVLWLVMSNGERESSGRYSGALYRTRGPAFDASPWTPAAVTATPVGTMTLAFTNGNAATLTYTVDGVTVTKTVERQVFSSPMPECEAARD